MTGVPSPALVTGATGFVGANLVRTLLDGGAEVHATVRPASDRWRLRDLPQLRLHEVDLEDSCSFRDLVGGIRPRAVFHLASPVGHLSPAAEQEQTGRACAMVGNVLAAAADAGARVVHGGSSLEYGPHPIPLHESMPLMPNTPRGRMKAAEGASIRASALGGGGRVVHLRLFSVYGPWESAARFISRATRAVLSGAPIALTPPGLRHDFVHVADVADALIRAATEDLRSGEVLNVGTGRQHANEEVVELLMRVAGRRVPLEVGRFPRRVHDATHWVADCSKTTAILGWSARRSLEDGLRETLRWTEKYGRLDPLGA